VNPSIDVEIVNISIHPKLPKEGDCVNITAYVRNNGVKNANVSVDLWIILKRDNISSPPPYDWQKEVGKKSIQVGEEIVNVSRVMYIKLLNHTNLMLEPGESKPVNATLNISVCGNPEYVVKAIVDPLDEIDEINESNNEMSKEIELCYPDLTVVGFKSPTRDDENAYVLIRNIGADNASNFSVKLELERHEKAEPIKSGTLNITSGNRSSGSLIVSAKEAKGVSKMKIHFASLEIFDGGYVEIYGKDGRIYDAYPYDAYKDKGPLKNIWTRPVAGDTVIIDYINAIFYIDEYACEGRFEKENATMMRILFREIDTSSENSYIDIYDGKGRKIVSYSGLNRNEVCTPWIEGNVTIIDYANAFFDIEELRWKEENVTANHTLNTSKTDYMLIPWKEYKGVESLTAIVDPPSAKHPYGNIAEQREDNNRINTMIYTDIEPVDVDIEEIQDKLIVDVSIRNRNDMEGIVMPAYNFNVCLMKLTEGDTYSILIL